MVEEVSRVLGGAEGAGRAGFMYFLRWANPKTTFPLPVSAGLRCVEEAGFGEPEFPVARRAASEELALAGARSLRMDIRLSRVRTVFRKSPGRTYRDSIGMVAQSG